MVELIFYYVFSLEVAEPTDDVKRGTTIFPYAKFQEMKLLCLLGALGKVSSERYHLFTFLPAVMQVPSFPYSCHC